MMKTLLSKIGFLALFISTSFTANAHVALDYPIGGETFIIGQTVSIQWHILVPHNTLNWDLYYSPDGGVTWDTIVLDIPTSQLTYEWEIPEEATSQGRVRVIQDNVGQNYQDDCMDFSIVPNTSPPSLDAPASNITIECNTSNQEAAIQAWLNDHGGAAATNYCGELTWTNDYAGYSNDCGATGSTIVIFEAVDACGMITTNATLTIADTSPPDVAIPASALTVETNGQGNLTQLNQWLNTKGGAQASDVCGDVIWTNNYTTLSDGCGSTGAASVIFTATDECGNSSNTIATFTIVDQTPPVIHRAAQDTVIACNIADQQNILQQWLNQHGGAQASDIGGDIVWTNNFSALSDGCGATGNAVVQFTATDECGNSIITTANINIVDLMAPTITIPAQNATLECTGASHQNEIQLWLDSHGGAQASDECGNVNWTNNFSGLSDGCGSTGSAGVVFTASDECGNSSTTLATISIEDKTVPVIEQAAHDTTVICGTEDQTEVIESWLNRQGGARASDVCGNVIWTNDFLVPDSCGPVGSHNVIFTAADECGNTVTSNAILTIMDTVITSIKLPEDLHFKIYPNPASEYITIAFDEFSIPKTQIILRDASGKCIWIKNENDREITFSTLDYAPGVYFLTVQTPEHFYSKKVIIH